MNSALGRTLLSRGSHRTWGRTLIISRGGCCCLSLFFARVVIIGRKKPKRVVHEHLLFSYAPLRHFHYALCNHFPHHARVRWPCKSTARFLNLTPRFVES